MKSDREDVDEAIASLFLYVKDTVPHGKLFIAGFFTALNDAGYSFEEVDEALLRFINAGRIIVLPSRELVYSGK